MIIAWMIIAWMIIAWMIIAWIVDGFTLRPGAGAPATVIRVHGAACRPSRA